MFQFDGRIWVTCQFWWPNMAFPGNIGGKIHSKWIQMAWFQVEMKGDKSWFQIDPPHEGVWWPFAPESRCFCWTLLAILKSHPAIDLQDLLCCVHMGKKDHQSDKERWFWTFCPVWIWGGYRGYSNFISHMRETRSEDKTYPGYAIPNIKDVVFVSRQLSRLWERPAFIDL